jgi:glycosyltransferase involved in cell wall biosynthesis
MFFNPVRGRTVALNVLLLCEFSTLNGGERSMLATLDGVRAAGFSPAVIAPPEGPLAETLRGRNVELIPLRTYDSLGTRRPQPCLREDLLGLISQRRPHLLHANSLAMGRLSGPVAAELNVPSLAHLRDIIKLSRRAVADLNCHRRLLAVSQATRQFHVAGGLSAEKTHVLHNGVDLDCFRPRCPSGYLHRELGLSPETLLVGAIGQIGLRKGHDVLLQAARKLAGELPPVHYVIIGARLSEKEESREFEAALRTAAGGVLAGRVHFLGIRDDVDRLLNELTLLVHPARQEPLGRVLLEAAAAAVPIIATDVGGTREIFPDDWQAANLVPPGDAEAIAVAMRQLLLDPALRGRLAAAARQRAAAAFDEREAATGLVAHYRQVIQSAASPLGRP